MLLERWHPGCGLWSVRAQGAVTACCSFSRRKKKEKKKKALKHKRPLGREEMSKDAAVTQAHSHMPEDDARKRQSLCVHKHMLSLSCVHCSQMIWKNTLQRHIVQPAIYPENKTKCKIGQAVKVFYCIFYKCCRTFNPYKYYAGNLPQKSETFLQPIQELPEVF